MSPKGSCSGSLILSYEDVEIVKSSRGGTEWEVIRSLKGSNAFLMGVYSPTTSEC